MKNLFNLFLIIIMMISFTACGTKISKQVEDNPEGNTNKEVSINEGDSKYQRDDDLLWTVRVNLTTTKYCMDSPGELIKRAGTGFKAELLDYFVIWDHYVDISSEKKGVDIKTIAKAEDIMDAMRVQVNEKWSEGLEYADSYDFEILSQENVTVNGWEMCKFFGEVTLSCKWPLEYDKASFVGYSVIKDGYPIYFLVIDKPTSDEKIDLSAMADKIAKTFREYEE